jgi:glycosyltransferase involved in cell wall biosynthesis
MWGFTLASLAVVMATYNGGSWISEQWESLLAQSRIPDQIIVSDDGSTDGTRDFLTRASAATCIPVTVVDGPQSGLADNFWFALSQTDCELVAWADQDDVWHPEKLAVCERALLQFDADFVSHSADVVDAEERPLGFRYPNYKKSSCFQPLDGDPWHVPSGFASVFRQSLVAGARWADRPVSHQTFEPMNHDHVVSLLAFARSRRVQLTESLANYRQHGSNAAGAPAIRGLANIKASRNVDSSKYHNLADIARGYGAFVGGSPEVDQYFAHLVALCESRASVYEGAQALDTTRRLARATRRGTYGRKSSGGFGVLSAGNDLKRLLERPFRGGSSLDQ